YPRSFPSRRAISAGRSRSRSWRSSSKRRSRTDEVGQRLASSEVRAVQQRPNVALEEVDDGLREGVVLVARHHVGGGADVPPLGAGNLPEEILHAFLGDDVAELAPNQQAGTCGGP